MENIFTLYCRGFPEHYGDSELRAVFSKYGNILKLFKHNSGTYAMIEYDHISACTSAIRGEHGVPPLELYVNLARNQPTDRKEPNETSPPQPNKYPKKYHQSEIVTSPRPLMPNNQIFNHADPIDKMLSPPQLNNSVQNIATLPKPKSHPNPVYEEDIIYMDRHNNILPVLKDFKDELYVPLSCVEGLKRYVKKTPICNGSDIAFNPDDYILLTNGSDDARSQHSNASGDRRVEFGDSFSDIKIKVAVGGASNSNTPESAFDSSGQASRSFASRYTQVHQQPQQTQFGGHMNENRQINTPENRPFNDKFTGNENRPYDDKRFPNQQYNRNKPYNQDQPRQFNKPYNQDQPRNFNKPYIQNQPRDFNKPFVNQDQSRDLNTPVRQLNFNQTNGNSLRRPMQQNRQFDNKPIEHTLIASNDYNWDESAAAPQPSTSTTVSDNTKQRAVVKEIQSPEAPVAVAKIPEESNKRSSIVNRLKVVHKPDVKYKTAELPQRVFTKIYITTVINATEGWVQLYEATHDFNNVFSLKVVQAANKAEPTTAEVGKMCLAFFEDYWFRAVVLETTPKLTVRYIDYGNEQEDPVGGVKSLCKELCDQPAFSMRIRLSDGAPRAMVEGDIMSVKPIKMDNDAYVVHVENGMYIKDEIEMGNTFGLPQQPAEIAPVNLLKKLQSIFMSYIHEGTNGMLEITTTLSTEKYTGYLFLSALTSAYAEVMEIIPGAIAAKFVPRAKDLVIAFSNGAWSRAIVLELVKNSYRVAFIDYGTISIIDEVKPLPEHLAKLPQFAWICNIYGNQTKLPHQMAFVTTSVSADSFTATLTSNTDHIYNAVITAWNPDQDNNTVYPATSIPEISPPVIKSPTSGSSVIAPKKPITLPILELRDGDVVRLVYIFANDLYVRTKEAHTILKRIEEHMKQYSTKGERPSASNMAVGQYVAAEYDGGWYRAVITDIKTSVATVVFVDYGNDEDKPIFTFKVLSDEICAEPCTLLKVKLRNFTNPNYNFESLEYLHSLSHSNTVFKVKFTSLEDGIDMITKDGINISDHLSKLANKASVADAKQPANSPAQVQPKPVSIPAPVISKPSEFENLIVPGSDDPLVTDIPIQQIPIGRNEVQFLCKGDWKAASVMICLNDPEMLHKVHVDLKKHLQHYCNNVAPPEPHKPGIEEYILAKIDDKWYRAVNISKPDENGEYSCFFIDYGSTSLVNRSNIRRIPLSLAKVPAIANFGNIEGIPVPVGEALISRLEELFLLKNIYEVDVLNMTEEGFYTINFPAILKVLKQEKFF